MLNALKQYGIIGLLVLTGVLIVGLLVIYYFSCKEKRKIERGAEVKPEERSCDVEWLLSLDDTERFYHN